MPGSAAALNPSAPAQPWATKCPSDQCGATTPMNVSSSKIASSVTPSSNAAAMPTPTQLSPMKTT